MCFTKDWHALHLKSSMKYGGKERGHYKGGKFQATTIELSAWDASPSTID